MAPDSLQKLHRQIHVVGASSRPATKMSVLGKLVDERFLDHRRRSTSFAGIGGGALAFGLFGYRYLFDHVWSWDLFAVGITIVAIKLALMTWYYLTD